MTPEPDDVDWAMGELFELIDRAHAAGTTPWRLDWDHYWVCMRVVYAQDAIEQRRLIRILWETLDRRYARSLYSSHAYARTH